MPASELIKRTAEALDALVAAAATEGAAGPGAPGVLVALSGGPDSVALVALAGRWAQDRGRPLAAAHFHHQLRGAEADRDRDFCRRLCADLGVALHLGEGDPRGIARQRGRGLEDAARELRLAFLERTRAAAGLAAIATGHHRDDQAETVLLRLFRGTGLDGLRGIAPRRGRLIRPLLAASREEILDLLTELGLPWRMDGTNTDGSNRRGRVRCELLPLVRDIFGEGADAAPARLADLVAPDLDLLDGLTTKAAAELLGPPLPGCHGPSLACRVGELHPALARRVVRRWLVALDPGGALPADLARSHVVAVLDWLGGGQSGTGLDLPGPLRLERVFDRVGAASVPPPALDPAAWRVTVDPLAAVPDPVPPPRGGPDRWELVCPAEALAGSLVVRAIRPGDRLQPFGMSGTKKLSDLLQERRVPAAVRPTVPVVADAHGPLWVPGVAQDERTRLLPSSRQAVTINLERRRSDPGS